MPRTKGHNDYVTALRPDSEALGLAAHVNVCTGCIYAERQTDPYDPRQKSDIGCMLTGYAMSQDTKPEIQNHFCKPRTIVVLIHKIGGAEVKPEEVVQHYSKENS